MENTTQQTGVTKRDLFAAAALYTIISIWSTRKPQDCATLAFQYADAMVEQSEKTQPRAS